MLKTILKIFCTLIEWLVEQKIKGAFIALEKRLACARARAPWPSQLDVLA